MSISLHDKTVPVSERLSLLTAEFEAAQEDTHRLVRTISHNLATPLTSTRWLLEALRERSGTKLGAEDTQLVDTALKNLDAMVGMIESLLSHTSVGKKSVHTGTLTSCRRAIDQALGNLRQEMAATGAHVSVDDLPEVAVDSTVLTCVFENLLSNAFKFRRAGTSPDVSVGAHLDGGWWVIAVSDNGIGIPAADQRRIFEPLQRLDQSIPGRGIGLATCRKIVERTGGRIWVDSEPGKRTTFRFTVPAHRSVGSGSTDSGHLKEAR